MNDISIDIINAVKEIKSAIVRAQARVSANANAEMLSLYFGIGRYVSYKTQTEKWGTGIIDTISAQLQKEMPGLSGGMNLYAAWRNTPLLLWDPYGLVDMNLFSRDDAISNYADRHNPAGVFSVGARGNAQDGVLYKKSDGKYYSIPVRSLARKIRRNPRCRHQPVQLDSCNVGNGQYPQQLANLLVVEVRAPTRFVWYNSTGVEYFGETATEAPNRDDPGELIFFMPNRSNYIFSQMNYRSKREYVDVVRQGKNDMQIGWLAVRRTGEEQ